MPYVECSNCSTVFHVTPINEKEFHEKYVQNSEPILCHGCHYDKPLKTKEGIHHIHLFLRNIRMERNELLLQMAEKFGLGVAELSAIEHGRKPVPNGFYAKLYKLYDLPFDFENLAAWTTLEEQLYNAVSKAEKLDDSERIPTLELVVLPLIERFESGERSSDLHARILDVTLELEFGGV